MNRWGVALAVAAALAALAAGTALVEARRGPEPSALAASDNPGPRGLAAGRELVRGAGTPVRTRAPGAPAAPDAAVTIVAAPAAPLGAREAGELVDRAARGATVVIALGDAPQPALLQALGLAFTPGGSPKAAYGLAPHPLVGDLTLPARAAAVAPTRPGPLAVSGGPGWASAVSVPAGRGELLVFSGPEALENAHLLEGGALSLWVRIGARGRAPGAGGVEFDERFLAPAAAPTGGRGALALALLGAQLLAAGAAFAWARGRRLGAVRPAPPGSSTWAGRTARAYLASLAALYRRAGAEPELAAESWRALRRRLERRWAIPARLSDADAARRLARRSDAGARAAVALARGSAALAGATPLLAVTRAAAEVEGALEGSR